MSRYYELRQNMRVLSQVRDSLPLVIQKAESHNKARIQEKMDSMTLRIEEIRKEIEAIEIVEIQL